LLGDTGLATAMLAMRSRAPSPWITVLAFHRALDEKDIGELEPGVVDVTPAALDRHVAYMKEWFDVVGLDDLFAFRRGAALPRNPLLITFDDGYADNYRSVLPILQKHGARATFFIATDYVGERRLFWWDKIALLLNRTRRDTITIDYPFARTFACTSAELRTTTREALLDVVKTRYGLDLDRFLDSLGAACDVSLARSEERAIADDVLMTWDQVRALRAAGMDVQSHTRTHRVLQTIDEPTLDRELVESRETLEDVLREPIRAVSYPVGKPLDLFPHIRKAVKRAGYELGFSNETGTSYRWSFDPLDARRIAVDVRSDESFFRGMLAAPFLMPQ